MKTPGISFVIPVYNMERYLPRVIQCLKAVSYTHLTLPTSDLV